MGQGRHCIISADAIYQPDWRTGKHMPVQDKRMVVIVHDDAYRSWLKAPSERTVDFLRQYPADQLVCGLAD